MWIDSHKEPLYRQHSKHVHLKVASERLVLVKYVLWCDQCPKIVVM